MSVSANRVKALRLGGILASLPKGIFFLRPYFVHVLAVQAAYIKWRLGRQEAFHIALINNVVGSKRGISIATSEPF